MMTTVVEQPLVSIGIPTYNRVEKLKRAVASAQSQSYPHLEIVISDNCSNDATESFCRDLETRDARVRYVRQGINRGATENFKAVLTSATGEFYMWLSDDDWLGPNYVESCLRDLRSHPECVAVCGRPHIVGAEKEWDEPLTNLVARSPIDRVVEHFRTVRHNAGFYSVMRRNDMLGVRYENEYANDWFFVGGLACLGEIRTASDAVLNKTLGGMSANPTALVRGLGLSRGSKYPWIKVGLRAFADIVWRNPAYGRLTTSQRIWLGLRAADLIWAEQEPRPPGWWVYRSVRQRLSRRLPSLSGTAPRQ